MVTTPPLPPLKKQKKTYYPKTLSITLVSKEKNVRLIFTDNNHYVICKLPYKPVVAHGIMVFVVGNGLCYLSSHLNKAVFTLHSINTLGEKNESNFSLSSYW